MDYPQDFLKQLMEQAQQQAEKAKKKAMRILIPTIIGASILLIGLGILIGKYFL
jgi:hypothetical protein